MSPMRITKARAMKLGIPAGLYRQLPEGVTIETGDVFRPKQGSPVLSTGVGESTIGGYYWRLYAANEAKPCSGRTFNRNAKWATHRIIFQGYEFIAYKNRIYFRPVS